MQKKFIVFFSLSCFLLIGTGAFFWIQNSRFISERVQSEIKKTLEPILNQSVQIEKSALYFFPPSIQISGITSAGKSTLSVKNIGVSFNLSSLLTQSFFVSEIIVDQPILQLSSESTINLPKQDKKPNVVIRRIRIQQGKFSYRSPDKEFHLDPFQITVLPNFKMDRFDIAMSSQEGRVLFSHREKKIEQFSGALIIYKSKPNAPIRIDVTKFNAQFDQTQLG
ncbi:MAG: hypothetical protein AAB317_00985, partial [Nitrospirota bacterium]